MIYLATGIIFITIALSISLGFIAAALFKSSGK